MDTYFVILEFHLQAGFEDAALTAFLTAITTTSCMGHGPF